MIELFGLFLGVGTVPCLLLGVIMLISFLTCDYIEKFVVKTFCSIKNRRRQRYRGKVNDALPPDYLAPQSVEPSAPSYHKLHHKNNKKKTVARKESQSSIEAVDRQFHQEKFRLVAAGESAPLSTNPRKFSVNIASSENDTGCADLNTPQQLENAENEQNTCNTARNNESSVRADEISTSTRSTLDEPPPSYYECFKNDAKQPARVKKATTLKVKKD